MIILDMQTTRKRILVVQPGRAQDRLSFMFMEQATARVAEVRSVSNLEFALEEIYEQVVTADLIVVDVTESSPAAMYVLGYAHATNKPVLILYESSGRVPFDLTGVPAVRYSVETQDAFIEAFLAKTQEALSRPSRFQGRLRSTPPGTSVFISYSRKDAEFLERLRVHMRPLEKAQRIELWDDTKIKAGQQWRAEIDMALKRAKAAVLLISADFLASDFAADNEVPLLLEKVESEGTLIIPVILKACRFPRDARLSKFQAINDPSKPLAELPVIEQERIYDRICQLVESVGTSAADRGLASA
jgi:hypothetical protein